MDINELKAPQFLINEAGMISVFLPAFQGEPENPVLTKKDETTLHYQRSADGDVFLTEIEPEIVEALSNVKKILVIETNVLKSIDILDKALTAYLKSEENNADDEMMDAIERAYEIKVEV